MKKLLLATFLVSFICVTQAQQSIERIPDHLKGHFSNLETAAQLLAPNVFPVESTSSGFRKSNGSTPYRVQNNQTEIGRMANTYATIGQNRIQIAHDPATSTVAAVFRGNDRSPSGNGNTLFVRYSSNQGKNWTAQGSNVANTASPRYPNIFLYNPTQSTNANDVTVSVLWPQTVTYPSTTTWGEVNAMTAGIGSTNRQYKKFPVQPAFPNYPNWSIPNEIMVSNTAGKLYTFLEAVEPSNGDGTRGYYLMTSSDNGLTWTPANQNLDPSWTTSSIPTGQSGINLCLDVSRDGSHVIFAYISRQLNPDNSVAYINSEHRIAYYESTDGGQTFPVDPVYIAIPDIPDLPEPIGTADILPQLGWDLDVTYDAKNNPHFLVTVSVDQNPYNPLDSAPEPGMFTINHMDSTFVCEVGLKGSTPYLNIIDHLRSIRIFRRSYSIEYSDGSQRAESIFHEPHWAVSEDGNKIYAKWIEADSTLKHPYLAVDAEQRLYIFSDSIHNIWVAGRDIRSNVIGGGWTEAQKVTENTEVGTKYSKMAHFAGNNGELHIIYTEWGIGERVDDDPINADNIMWYVNDVTVSTAVNVEQVSSHPGSFELSQNYPNPFNPSTQINFTLPVSGDAKLKVYNLLGKEVATIINGFMEAGSHKVTFDASKLSSGTYVYRLESGKYVASRTMTLVK